jgi:uncharacterized protein (DUF934 family)
MKFIDTHTDPWRLIGGEDGPPVSFNAAPSRLLTLTQWHAARQQWPLDLPLGLSLDNTAAVETLAADVPRFSLITLHFPKWTDGRAYSQARLLRSRLRYRGELRATGEVLVDMLPLLQRTGFDAAQLRHDQSLDAARRALGFFPGHYQGDVVETRPHFARTPA